MGRKLNYLRIIPLYGAIILWLYLFIKLVKQEINKRIFCKYFWRCGLLSGFLFLALMLGLVLISKMVDINGYIGYGIIMVVIIGGYLINLATFKALNQYCDELIECR